MIVVRKVYCTRRPEKYDKGNAANKTPNLGKKINQKHSRTSNKTYHAMIVYTKNRKI